MFRFPWGDFHSLNLGWFLQKFNELREDWATAEAGIDGALDAEIQKAEDALTDVFAARDAAAASASAANSSALNASQSSLASMDARDQSRAARDTAQQAAGNAAASETAAGNSAAAAAASETAAGQSASNAEDAAESVEASAQQIATNTSDIADLKGIIVNPGAFPWIKPEYKKITMAGGGTVEKFGSVFRVNGARGTSALIDLRELKTALATELTSFRLDKQIILRVRVNGRITTTIPGTQIYVNIFSAGTSSVAARIGDEFSFTAGEEVSLCAETILAASSVPQNYTINLQLRATVYENLIVSVEMVPYNNAVTALSVSTKDALYENIEEPSLNKIMEQ